MRLNSDRALELGRVLFHRFGGNWQAVREAGIKRPDGVIDMTTYQERTEAEPSAAARVTKALDMACRYSGGIAHGDGPNAETLLWGDIRDVVDQRADLLGALRLADAALSGANMNMQVVERAVRAALAKATGVEATSPTDRQTEPRETP